MSTIEEEMSSQREELAGEMQDEGARYNGAKARDTYATVTTWATNKRRELLDKVPASKMDLALRLWGGTYVEGNPHGWLVAWVDALVTSKCLDVLAARQVDLTVPIEDKLQRFGGKPLEVKHG